MLRTVFQYFALALAAGIGGASLAWGQGTADRLLDRALDAHGRSALEALHTVVIEGEIQERGATQPLTITISLDGHARWDFLAASRSIVTTPSLRFEIRGGEFAYRPPHAGAFAQLDVLGGAALFQWIRAGGQRTFIPGNILENQLGLGVRVDTARAIESDRISVRDVKDVYIDPSSGLVKGVSRRGLADRSEVSFVDAYAFSDHREVQGILFPHRIERYLDGALQQVITVRQVELNLPVDFRMFEFR